jgi:hypothetical protein
MGSGTLLKLTHDMRLSKPNGNACVFRAHTKSGHIELSSLKKQHLKAIGEGTRLLREKTKKKYTELEPFELYTFRHTRLTRWAPTMDPCGRWHTSPDSPARANESCRDGSGRIGE